MPTSPQESASILSSLLMGISGSRIVVLLMTLSILRFIVRVVYRVYFHPLSKFPGPKLRAATRIPANIETIFGTRHITLHELHRKYGHVVRVNHDELSWTDPDSWKDIYGHGTKGTKGSPPAKAWPRYGQPVNGVPNLIQSRDPTHGRQRKIFTPAFSDRALKQQEPLFLKYTDQLVSKLRERTQKDPEELSDMVRMFNFTTFDIMGDLTFGEPLHMLDNTEYDPWVSVIFSSIKIASRIDVIVYYPLLSRPFRALISKSWNENRLRHFDHSVTRVTNRLEKGRNSDGVDLWDLVLAQKEGNGLSRGEMDSNASLFMIAGTETTATLLSGLLYLLLKNPTCLSKLVEEIRGAFTSSDDMTMEQLAALPYFGACIKEAFRLYPPVPLGLPRLTPEEGSTVCGQFIPPNTILSIPQAAMYTQPLNFRRPLEYLPERWLGAAGFESDQRQALQPFGVGSRDCVGKNMAYHEMRIIMAKVLYNFDIELAAESSDWTKQGTYILWEKKPLMCKLTAVN